MGGEAADALPTTHAPTGCFPFAPQRGRFAGDNVAIVGTSKRGLPPMGGASR
jgi:hypothetical protein